MTRYGDVVADLGLQMVHPCVGQMWEHLRGHVVRHHSPILNRSQALGRIFVESSDRPRKRYVFVVAKVTVRMRVAALVGHVWTLGVALRPSEQLFQVGGR